MASVGATPQLQTSPPPQTSAEAGSPAPELQHLQSAVDQFMAEYLATARPSYIRGTVNAQLYDDAVEFVCRPGKRLRPVLFLLAHRIFQKSGTERAERDLLAIGTSLELLHGFILIHDDIIDRSELRRGRPTLHRVLESRLPTYADPARIGKNLSLVLGDILFALAQQCLLDTQGVAPTTSIRLSRMLLGCLMETGFGEAADIFYGTRDVAKIGLTEIEQMYLLKTTRYTIECPLAMAAVLAGASEEAVLQIERVARPAGLAFQVQNDLQEFERFEISDAEVPADFLEGKKTLLIHTAFELLGETDRALLQLCLTGSNPSEASVSMAKELVTKSGAVACLRRRMQDLLDEAAGAANDAVFSEREQVGLNALIRLVRDAANRSNRPA